MLETNPHIEILKLRYLVTKTEGRKLATEPIVTWIYQNITIECKNSVFFTLPGKK